MKIIEELKRRKVLRTLGVYGAAAIVISQLVATIFPYLFLPNWTVTFVIVLVILGFPITLFLSWTYDLQREGETDDKSEIENVATDKKWSLTKKILFPVTGFILMLIGGIFWFIYPFLTISMGHERDYDASIAILYMENISPEEKNYFADGLTEELINRISRIQNLKVRPRTDVAVFKNKTVSINEIAKELSVNYIVEGSVQIIGDKLRVSAKLFDIAQDKITWSDSYKRELTDFFDVQDDIASKIVAKLDEKLTISTMDLTATKRQSTDNLEAYNLIMKAYEHLNNPLYSMKITSGKIIPLAEEALKLDSTYAEAYSILSLGIMFNWVNVPTGDDAELRKQEIKDINKTNLFAKTALQYDQDNLLAHTIITFLPIMHAGNDEFEANKLFILRSMLFDAKMFLQKYPDALISQYIYAMVSMMKIGILDGEKEEFQEPLDQMLAIFQKLKRNDFVLSHPTEGIVLGQLWGDIANLYFQIGDGKKGMDFIIENKQFICGDGTYECLNVDILWRILNGFYNSNYYENALDVISIVLSRNEEELIAAGNTISDKKGAYYKSGMIYMKWGQFDKAIEGFSQALTLSWDYPNLSQDVNDERNTWWNAHYYRRMGLVYSFMGEYHKASNAYLEAIQINENIEYSENDLVTPLKSICFYGYMQELIGNSETAKENMLECAKWIEENSEQFSDDWGAYHAYETLWPLYLYQKQMKVQDKASKYLNLAYEIIGPKQIEKYHQHSDKDTHPDFFYSRDIIKAYENTLNQ